MVLHPLNDVRPNTYGGCTDELDVGFLPNQGTTVEIALPLTGAGIAEEFDDPA